MGSLKPSLQTGLPPPSRWSWIWFHTWSLWASNPTLVLLCLHICDNPPRKIPYYRLNQSTLVIKQ
jgi:hypothetical protein